jgi:hypothetical protein
VAYCPIPTRERKDLSAGQIVAILYFEKADFEKFSDFIESFGLRFSRLIINQKIECYL